METMNHSFNLPQITPPSSSFGPTTSVNSLGRAATSSTNQPGPQQSTSFQQPWGALPRSTSMSSHSHSRSSPTVGTDQKYLPFQTTPEASKYASVPGVKQFGSQIPFTGPSRSPLVLADIRPRAELQMGDELSSPSYMNDSRGIVQTTSSYLAPWAIYAYDWCNWPVAGGAGAGKMAICSYLEDPHNFVSNPQIFVSMPNA